jgi:hypothetical protein
MKSSSSSKNVLFYIILVLHPKLQPLPDPPIEDPETFNNFSLEPKNENNEEKQ